MIKEVIDGFKRWITHEDFDSLTGLLSRHSSRLNDLTESFDSRLKALEAAEKSRADAMDFISSAEEMDINPVCDDCVSMRLELDALRDTMAEMKSRLEAVEAAGKSRGRRTKNTQTVSAASDSKPKRGRRKIDAANKELDS